jgi:hypothetical protein
LWSAQRYWQSPEPQEELMQVGYVGLLKAINNFDPAVGSNLAAYAQPCISGEIKRRFRDKRWQVHVKRSPRCGTPSPFPFPGPSVGRGRYGPARPHKPISGGPDARARRP